MAFDCRFHAKRRRQARAKHKTAMQVCPQWHQQDQPPARGFIRVPRRGQSCRPDRQQRQRQHVGPRQKTCGDTGQTHHHRQKRRQEIHAAAHIVTGGARRQRGGTGKQQMDAAPSGPPAQRHDDLGQPFLSVPGRVPAV